MGLPTIVYREGGNPPIGARIAWWPAGVPVSRDDVRAALGLVKEPEEVAA